jgi:uncharacterized short protein YbdD (DUF466 family)
MQDMSDLRKSIAERLGIAAKFTMSAAKYRAFVYRGSPSSNVLVKATEWMDSAIAAEEAAKQIAMSFRGQPGYNSDNYFADIAQETPMGAKTVKNYVRFSRPGEKAKFDTYTDMVNELRRATSGAIGVEWHTIANTWLSRKRASGNRELAVEANRAYDLVEREHLARGKRTASRPGAKAKMAMIPIGTMRRLKKNYDEYLAYLHRNDPKRKPMSFDEFVDEHKESVENSPMFDSNQFSRPGAKGSSKAKA